MASKSHKDPVELFREIAGKRLSLPVPEFHSRWLHGELVSLARSRGFHNAGALVGALVQESTDSDLWGEVIHAITVHETYWMRNHAPLKQALKAFGSNKGELRILSLGCAYGQEAYTAFLMARHFHPRAQISVSGIDLSRICIDKASRGRFSLTSDFADIETYLQESDGDRTDGAFQFSDPVKKNLSFAVGNILDPYIAGYREHDLILCQNCLTYYDAGVREKVASNLVRSLDAGGLLIFAGAELMGSRPDGAVALSDEWAQIFVKEF